MQLGFLGRLPVVNFASPASVRPCNCLFPSLDTRSDVVSHGKGLSWVGSNFSQFGIVLCVHVTSVQAPNGKCVICRADFRSTCDVGIHRYELGTHKHDLAMHSHDRVQHCYVRGIAEHDHSKITVEVTLHKIAMFMLCNAVEMKCIGTQDSSLHIVILTCALAISSVHLLGCPSADKRSSSWSATRWGEAGILHLGTRMRWRSIGGVRHWWLPSSTFQ
jgi:hypothetical protein